MTELGICSECEARDKDDSEKKLSKCECCGNYYCSDHIKPKVSAIIYTSISNKNEYIAKFLEAEKQLAKKGHLDWEYSRAMFLKLEKEQLGESKKILKALDEMKEADKILKRKQEFFMNKLLQAHPIEKRKEEKPTEEIQQKKSHLPAINQEHAAKLKSFFTRIAGFVKKK